MVDAPTSLFASCISFLLVRVVRHARVLETPVTCSTISLFHAFSALSIAAGGIELLRGTSYQEQSDEGGED